MNQDDIAERTEKRGYRALAGCLGRFVLMALVAGAILGLVARHSQSPLTRPSVWFALMGLLFGSATSILADGARRMLLIAFVSIGVTFSLLIFSQLTMFGYAHQFPLTMAIAPLLLPVGFVIGQLAWNIRK